MTTLTASSLRPTAPELAAATPARRDRYVDFLRVFSLAVVMLGHWLMAVVEWRHGRLAAGNILKAEPAAQWLTWIFQIMPVFFLVGGFSNTASWTAAVRDGRGYGTWLSGRLVRLVRPVLAFAVVWSVAVVALRTAGVDPAGLRAGSIAQPLWFLAVYLVVVTVAPAMIAAGRRWGWAVPGVLAGAVALVDLARWGFGVPLVGWANLGLVWLFAHQLGICWRQGGVAEWSGRRGRTALVFVAGLGGLFVLTGLAGYPHSMVGGVGEARSNMFPPSLALVAMATWQFAAALALKPVVDRWLARPRAWGAVVAANGVAMTVFLWHLTALVLVAAVALPTSWMPQPATGSAAWWAWRPVWLVALAAVLVPLVALFARVELRRVTLSASTSAGRALLAAALVTVGMAFLARRGFANPGMPVGLPVVALAALAGGWAVLRRA